MKMYAVLFVLSVLVTVGQSAKIEGPCPIKIKEIISFDPNRYLGKWWDTYTGSSGYGCGGSSACQVTYFSGYHEDIHRMTVNYYSGPNYGSLCAYQIFQSDYDVDARLFYYGKDDSLYVLDTDYESYAVEVACINDDGLTHEEKVVLRSRNMTMPDDVRDKLAKKITDYGFAEPDLVAHNYTGCLDFNPDSWHI